MIHAAAAEDRALAETRVAEPLFVGDGNVGGLADIDDQRGVGAHGITEHLRAVEAVFLADRRRGDDARLELFARLGAEPQCLRRDEGADAVVAGARDVDVAVEPLPADDVSDEIADRDALLGRLATGRADVDEEFVEFGNFRFLAPVLHVNCQRADDAEHLAVTSVDVDALAARRRR